MKPFQAARFRFSMRALLVLFALIAIAAGLLGRTINGYLQERRVEKRLESTGADVMLSVVPPTETIGKLLYRFGFRDIFHRVINVEYDPSDQWSNYLASEISKLPHLKRLKLEGVAVTDEQLKIIAESPELRSLEIHLDTRLLAVQRERVLSSTVVTLENEIDDLNMQLQDSTISEAEQTRMRDRVEACWDALELEKEKLAPKLFEDAAPPTVTDEGLLSLVDHPSLNSLSIRGCGVTDDAIRAVMTSIGVPSSNVELTVRRRFQDELMLSGTSICAIDETTGKRQFNIPADAKLVRVEVRDSFTDLARLPFTLPPKAKWELSFPRHVPLNGRNEGGFRIADFLRDLAPHADRVQSIVAEDGSPELWEVVAHCPKVSRLTLRGDGEVDLRLMREFPSLEELYLDNAVILDQDVPDLAKLKNLKLLSLSASALTTHGLQELADSGLRLEELRLPGGYAAFEDYVRDLEVAKRVRCEGPGPVKWFFSEAAHVLGNFGQNPDQPGKRDWELRIQGVIQSIERAISQAEFPWPEGSPYRPEDAMLYLQRRALLAWWKVGKSEEALKQLKDSLQRTPQANVAIEKLIREAPHLRLKFASQHTDAPQAHLREWSQLSEIYGVIADDLQGNDRFTEALEMRVRQTAWAPHASVPLPTDLELAELCHKAADSPEALTLKRYFFLLPKGSGEQYKRPTNMAEWKPGKPRGIAVLAPKDKQLTMISSNDGPLKVHVEGVPIQVRDKRAILPATTQIAYVDEGSFPISVWFADFRSASKD